MVFAGVALEKALSSFDRIYHYHIPPNMNVDVGMRVLVPFGRGNTPRVGLVLEVKEHLEGIQCKSLLEVIDREPILDDEGIFLVRALKETTFCSYFEGFRALVPPGIGMEQKEGVIGVEVEALPPLSPEAEILYQLLKRKRKMTDKKKLLKDATCDERALQELLDKGLATSGQLLKRKVGDQRAVMARLVDTAPDYSLTPKQQGVMEFLSGVTSASLKEICYFCGVGQTVVENLQKKGTIELYEEIVYREFVQPTTKVNTDIVLSPYQEQAFSQIRTHMAEKKKPTTLLYGVTGSGKTQIFIRLIMETLKQGKGVIVLVPEIGLTPQTVAEFTSRFGERVALLHSALSMGERLDQWRKIKDGQCDVVIGTRMAVFAPLQSPGLIVIDEEQEHTYHSESTPRYHARDIAILRAKRGGGHVLLCSATPSVESYYHGVNGRYNLVELTRRYARNGLPPVVTVDMQVTPKLEGSSIISSELGVELTRRLNKGEQSILLLNRRGYHTMVRCSSCQTVAKCPHCSVALTYHQVNESLVCHYCGYTAPAGGQCVYCKQPLTSQMGIGTQRVEQEIRHLFPEARVLRMDMDTTMTKYSHQRQFEAFAKGEYDIMVGTQMVAKGLNFPKVTLVGVLAADQSLYNDDFRAYERTFSLLTQVVGRCGRGELPGMAYVQTYTPDNEVIGLAAEQNYKAYYSMEIPFRESGLYPPYCDLATIAFYHEKEDKLLADALYFGQLFGEIAKEQFPTLPIRLLGPTEAAVYKQADRYRLQYLCKCINNKQTRKLFSMTIAAYGKKKDVALCTIDMNG